MPAARGIRVLLALVAVMLPAGLLAGCGLAGAASSPGARAAYHDGVRAGRHARHHHKFGHNASHYDVASFCIGAALRDVRTVRHSAVTWTSGFEKGCLER